MHRVAISDNRIIACDESSVTFRYQPSKSKMFVTRRVDGNEFVRGFVQHMLPSGFQKIRHYGWMSSNSKVSIDELKWRCAECGGTMRVVDITFEPTGSLSEHALAYLDSGLDDSIGKDERHQVGER